MGKPLSRPDCLRQNPPCVGKGEEDEDLNIEDCYVPQRSIYDTVRLNEQIDSGSKGSLSSRHFTDRTLPYSHRTLDISTLCSNGALTSSSVFELRSREASKLDEKMIFDALKLNSDIIRTAGLPKAKSHTEKKEHRRSWRMFVPPNFSDYTNKSECSFNETADMSDTARSGKCKWGTNSLTSEEDDSGLCSPPTEREEKQDTLLAGEQAQIRSLSSAEDIHAVGQFRPYFPAICREQQTPLLASSSVPVKESCRSALHDILPSGKVKQSNAQTFETDQEEVGGKYSHLQGFKEKALSQEDPLQSDGRSISLDKNEVENAHEVHEKIKTRVTTVEEDYVDDGRHDIDVYYSNIAVNTSDLDLAKYEILSNTEESSIACTGSNEVVVSVEQRELDSPVNCPKAVPERSKGNIWTTGIQETLDTVCNGLLSNKVAQRAAQLQEALLHCGRFQDALESLLSWLIDTEDLVANQKPPSAEFKVVKAQIQEQKVSEMR
ncbi:dystonin-like [Limosa lapponica baueri]|uniref:Dystonin-like n=1 Tax=Limosa lapponica baueri TaxID=1758121 RepID=A0A2I0TEC1_LIMLA|nr:dystonin-like [Limosa lapponica baueri]